MGRESKTIVWDTETTDSKGNTTYIMKYQDDTLTLDSPEVILAIDILTDRIQTTKEGLKIASSKLEDEHLKAILKLLKNKKFIGKEYYKHEEGLINEFNRRMTLLGKAGKILFG